MIWNYFDAVAEKWPNAWEGNIEQGMLNRTNGFNALMRFFRPAYLSISVPGNIVSSEQFFEIFKDIKIEEAAINAKNYVPGTSGAAAFYNDLMRLSNL